MSPSPESALPPLRSTDSALAPLRSTDCDLPPLRRGGGGGLTDALLTDYEQRFPEQKDSLARLLQQHALLESFADGRAANSGRVGSFMLALPGAGDEVFDFRLRHELGRGAFARVFLAEQTGLADRPVVLKVSAIEGDEPQTLAQLQHTNIVPIYSVHEDPKAGLRAVCMPYFGGASLSSVLRTLWADSPRPLTGAQLVQALLSLQSPSVEDLRSLPGSDPSQPPLRKGGSSCRGSAEALEAPEATLESLRGRKYLDAAVWIISRLATALEHAHVRGVLHRDIKPSNILLAADGQPMLLDFNLAQHTHHAQAAATLGGTVAYMAPEHLRALAGRDPVLARKIAKQIQEERAPIERGDHHGNLQHRTATIEYRRGVAIVVTIVKLGRSIAD